MNTIAKQKKRVIPTDPYTRKYFDKPLPTFQ